MTAVQARHSPGHMGRTRDLLIETLQLTEPRKAEPVPNHLLESKIYSKLVKNATVQAKPAAIHFTGFQVGKVSKQPLHLANVSTEVQRMHIIPPQTQYFKIKYTKGERLVPGLTLDCTIEFFPDECRYFYDCIRIHTMDEENLVVPIHAYPVMNTDDFPSFLNFPMVPVGHVVSRAIPLRCIAPVDFEFEVRCLQPHPAFTVDPMGGVIAANSEVDITVTYSPSEYSTAQMKLQVLIAQFNAKPLICTVTGVSAPGLAKEMTEASRFEEPMLDPRAITPVERARSRKLIKQQSNVKSAKTQEVEYEGIKFSNQLDTPYAVSQVLNQNPGKLRMKDLRQAINSKKKAEENGGLETSRQMKEAMFEMAVRKDSHEERQNQLRWQVKIGADHMADKAKQEVLANRTLAWQQYKRQIGEPVPEEEYKRSCTRCSAGRTIRGASKRGEEGVKFDMYSNNMWAVRHTALGRFQQAARKVIIRQRADNKIRSLKDTMVNWGKKKFATTLSEKDDEAERKEKLASEEEEEDVTELVLEVSRIRSVTFPSYTAPSAKDDMAVDALGPISVRPTEVIVKNKVPYFDLKVPQQYKLMGYTPHNVQEAASSYVPLGLPRQLRTGAEDEIISLPVRQSTVVCQDEAVVEDDMRVMEVTGDTPVPADDFAPLKPPPAMFQPIQYPPLHIFNPAPGLQVFLPPLPYAETDADFHLCPLPRYTNPSLTNPHMATQKKYLDKEHVIAGVMTWKRFPSQGLTSLANTPTLTNVWVPRWNDPFSDDMLPQQVPTLYDGLSEADREVIQEQEEDEEGLQLTPDMVNAQFHVHITAQPPADDKGKKVEEEFPHGNKMPLTNIPVSATGPVPREQREKELEYFLNKKYNRLGSKFQEKISTQDSLKTDPKLVLK